MSIMQGLSIRNLSVSNIEDQISFYLDLLRVAKKLSRSRDTDDDQASVFREYVCSIFTQFLYLIP